MLSCGFLIKYSVMLYSTDVFIYEARWAVNSECYDTPLPLPPVCTPEHLQGGVCVFNRDGKSSTTRIYRDPLATLGFADRLES